MTKSIHCGNAARLGLEACLLAKEGFTAESEIFEHSAGYKIFFKEFNHDFIIENFGNPFRLVEPGIAIKKYPCHYACQRAIKAVLELHEQYKIDCERIKKIFIDAPPIKYLIRSKLDSGLEGKFSMEYMVASALMDGKVDLDTFTDKKVQRPEIACLLNKTAVTLNPDIPPYIDEMWITIKIVTEENEVYERCCLRPRGNPLTREEKIQKTYACMSRVLSNEDITRLINIVVNFENLSHIEIKDLIALLYSAAPRENY